MKINNAKKSKDSLKKKKYRDFAQTPQGVFDELHIKDIYFRIFVSI